MNLSKTLRMIWRSARSIHTSIWKWAFLEARMTPYNTPTSSDEPSTSKVEGRPIGRPSTNPLLDSRQYEVEFMDGEIEILTANIIAENLLAQVDEEGRRQMFIAEIEDHQINDDAVPVEDGTFHLRRVMKRKKRTTKGWELSVCWKDGSSTWISLKDPKDTYPVELAGHAIANQIQEEPAFAWWVPYVIRKRTAIISKLR
jgi:hypothetical protein